LALSRNKVIVVEAAVEKGKIIVNINRDNGVRPVGGSRAHHPSDKVRILGGQLCVKRGKAEYRS
jgi:hypothetical protein